MNRVTLVQAMDLAAETVAAHRQQHGALYDQAVAHHAARGLTANLEYGTTRDRDGERSRFTDYNWRGCYEVEPAAIYADFFQGALLNSVDRMKRGLKP